MLTELIGSSDAVVALREEVCRLLQRETAGRSLPPILIEGETGTGKGLLASAIHRAGSRCDGPFVAVNCAAIPETLLEAELFGFERGAFTDARQAKAGLVETAHRGTLFLDEIGLLPEVLQGKLLTVLEERTVRRLGRTRSEPVDIAILAATSEDLRRAVREHRFREALYHRLSVLTLRLPPLRERGDDIALLAEHWLARSAAEYGLPVKSLGPDARAALLAYAWPGNVRELRNRMERVTLLAEPGLVTSEVLGLAEASLRETPESATTPDDARLRARLGNLERETLVEAITGAAWNITRAAARLGVPATTLRYRLRKYGLLRERPSRAAEPAFLEDIPRAPDSRPAPDVGRRQLTVLSCRLAPSGSRSGRLDADDVHDGMRDALQVCAETVDRFGGHVAQYQVDAFLAYFGHPSAHEDDARRAVHAALGIVEATRARGTALLARLGVHTGVVVVREVGSGDRRDHVALGEAPHVAAELQASADLDTVVISAATYRLIEGYFACEAREAPAGGSGPPRAYRVLHESDARGRLEAAATRMTPLVGRQHEVDLLVERWGHATEGRGQAVLISGEAGIGKSRLVRALEERIAGEPHTRIAFHCSSHHQNSALYPIIDHLARRLLFSREDAPQDKVRRLEAALEGYRLSLEDAVPVFALLLSLPVPDRYPALVLTPQRRRQKTLEVLRGWLLEEAEQQVMLAVWEDLQWADPSTLELLGLLLEQAATARLLVVVTSRPEAGPGWLARPHLTHIALGRLSHGQTEAMVANVLGGRALRGEVLEQLVARTDGVPLFVEELTRMMIEAETRSELLPAQTIPSTLHDSLMARLDRLGPGREVAQLGAVLGREFSYELIQAVSPMDAATLRRELSRLAEAQLLYRKGVPPQERYVFKHALIQDAAYQSLLKSARHQHHERIARVLQDRFRDVGALHPELVAHHYSEAGLVAEAVVYWQRAGQRAIERSASAEALVHLRLGLTLLETLPDTPGRAQQELALQLTLGAALLMTKGYTAPEVEEVYTRARALRASAGDSPQLFLALLGLWRFHISRAELETAHDFGQECFALAQRLGDPALLVNAHFALGVSAFHMGRFAAALAELERGIAIYDPVQHASLAFFHGAEVEVACRCYAARTLWFLGYPDRALEQSEKAMALAQQSSHTYTVGYALHLTSAVHTYRRDPPVVQQLADAAIALAHDQGFERWLGSGLMRRGWALAEQGAPAEGIAQLLEGLVLWRSHLGLTHFLAMLAEAHARTGDFEAGLQVVDDALALARRSAEHHYEAELHRLRGELALRQGTPRQDASRPEPEACFRRAIEIARSQGATSLELRAVMSLSRLWQSRGKLGEARQMLAEIHGRFTEGFASADLREARALLDELR